MTSPESRIRDALADRYTLGDPIGRGGFATVYRAHDIRNNRQVAIKVLRPELAAALGTDRFVREIEIEARLQHPHILPLHDSGTADGVPYFVMPLIEGESLRERLRRDRQLSVSDAIKITREVGDALYYAHTQGVVHRDIKPENILLAGGYAYVADFGIAHALEEVGEERLTSAGVTLGTPPYMSPEQAAGDAQLDGRSDLYALGCVLYEMLAGDPPYTGATAQAIFARQMHEPPPPLEVVRPNVPPAVVDALETALAQVPADRFATVPEFLALLGDVETKGRLTARRATIRRRRYRTGTIIAAAAVLGGAGWLLLRPTGPPLDANKVVVFPLVEQNLPVDERDAGYRLAVVIETALEYSRPLKWIDGWERLDERQRGDAAAVDAKVRRRIARDRGAKYYIAGFVQGQTDSLGVTLQLYDAGGDSLIRRGAASGASAEVALHQLAVDAVKGVLADLIDPGRPVDFAALRDREASAVALWIQGERQYRQLHMTQALDLYQRALARDSSLVIAAVKGAQAASWKHSDADISALIDAALRRDSLLPARYASFARGLRSYTSGQADSAVRWLEQALDDDPDWNEALAALGEVYVHLLPRRAPLDSLAEAVFLTVIARDTGFAPPLFHLAEMAVRRGELPRAQQLIRRLMHVNADTALVRQLGLMVTCVEDGAGSFDWLGPVLADALVSLRAAGSLAAAGAQVPCAENGFRAVLGSSFARTYHWGAFLGLQGVLAATGRFDALVALVDSMTKTGTAAAQTVYLVDDAAGAPLTAKALEVAAYGQNLWGPTYEGLRSTQFRWLYGVWHARRKEWDKARPLLASLERDAAASGSPVARSYADALAAMLSAAHGGPEREIGALTALTPAVPQDTLAWKFAEPLAIERLTLALMLLDAGRYDEAHQVATVFDHPGPIIYLPFVPVSLWIRRVAALEMGDDKRAERYRERLLTLGRADLIDAPRNLIFGEVRNVAEAHPGG
ncbi:MAG: serine/threonine protein kinase [Gemmatimonadota bacterium]|nr:serine/threonine protein kinase [Gemmatimonadota bacterium]